MKTRTKILGLAGILSLMTAILAFISYNGLNGITDQAEKLYSREMQGAKYASQIETDILYVIRDEKNILLSNTDADLQKFMQQLDKGRQELNKDAAEIKKYYASERGKALIAKLDAALAEWSKIHEEVVRLAGVTGAEVDHVGRNRRTRDGLSVAQHQFFVNVHVTLLRKPEFRC